MDSCRFRAESGERSFNSLYFLQFDFNEIHFFEPDSERSKEPLHPHKYPHFHPIFNI